jgi:hypothetical protein
MFNVFVMKNKSKIIHRGLLISGAGKTAYPQDVFFLIMQFLLEIPFVESPVLFSLKI